MIFSILVIFSKFHVFSDFLGNHTFSLKRFFFCDLPWACGAGTRPTVTDGQTSRKRGRVSHARPGGRQKPIPLSAGRLRTPASSDFLVNPTFFCSFHAFLVKITISRPYIFGIHAKFSDFLNIGEYFSQKMNVAKIL